MDCQQVLRRFDLQHQTELGYQSAQKVHGRGTFLYEANAHALNGQRYLASTDLNGTNSMLGRVTAPPMAASSLAAFLPRTHYIR
jgi:hypothetical protein